MLRSDIRVTKLIAFIREIYEEEVIPLHRPVFEGNEKRYLLDCIDSNFVSSVGANVIDFETSVAEFCGFKTAVATMNGTAALHAALALIGVEKNTEVLTQALTFVATANAISYLGAKPVFIDVDRDTLGMSPASLRFWLENNTDLKHGVRINIRTRARISACVPMHTFGLPLRIAEVADICREFSIPLIEDTAESLGSCTKGRHTGTFGKIATFSFNGNKIITTGGGGMMATNDLSLAARARHITTTAKKPHPYDFYHDQVGYNYRLPNLNAALGIAQMELLPSMLKIKAELAKRYRDFAVLHGMDYITGLTDSMPNHWLNAIVLETEEDRDLMLKITNEAGVMTRPIWRLMTELPMYRHCQTDGLQHSKWLAARVINLPSSVPKSEFQRLAV